MRLARGAFIADFGLVFDLSNTKDNKNLRALVEKKKPADCTSVSPPTLSDGDDVAQVSKPVSAVTLPELRAMAMAHLSQKVDCHVAQLGLASSSASSSDLDDQRSEIQSPLRKTDKRSHAHTGKSLKSGKEAKITSTGLYPQSWPHCYLSITLCLRDLKYEELRSRNSLPVMARSSYPQIYRRWNVPHVLNIWFR